jgi:hypothetical protein
VNASTAWTKISPSLTSVVLSWISIGEPLNTLQSKMACPRRARDSTASLREARMVQHAVDGDGAHARQTLTRLPVGRCDRQRQSTMPASCCGHP